ncbi:hypothetical protein BU17DRAFT_83364 [Hysterangium stoloniferum]|nr:hypothetical protein BU17DRAFT_83364 [Hysterangium stoloniferum]
MKSIFEALGLRNRPSVHSGFPPLPIELVRAILEVAAAGSRSTAVALSLVSKDVHSWTKPILYHTVILSTPQQLASFHNVTLTTDPTVARHVTNLFFRSMSIPSGFHALRILSACSNVKRLVVDALFRYPSVDERHSWPKPWEVVYIYGATTWLHTDHPSLSRVTHLHMDGVLFSSTIDVCVSLPCLTHLGITHVEVATENLVYDENFVRLIQRALLVNRMLKMLLIQLQPAKGVIQDGLVKSSNRRPSIWRNLAKIADVRLLARPALVPEEYLNILETGRTIWDDASMKFAKWRVLSVAMDVDC